MVFKMCVLRSGSSGNCTAIWTRKTALLIDCGGISVDSFPDLLKEIHIRPSNVKGIIITHGHGDHIGPHTVKITNKFKIPLYIHRKTYNVIKHRQDIQLQKRLVRHHSESSFSVGNFCISPFRLFHSGGYAGKTFGFCISLKNKGREYRVGYLTDTKKVTGNMIGRLCNCIAIAIEANHDLSIVNAKHPRHTAWQEHLNNDEAADAIEKMKKKATSSDALKYIFVMHVSEQHNKPKKPLKIISKRLKMGKIKNSSLIRTYHERKSRIIKLS